MAKQRTIIDDFLDALKGATIEFVEARLVDLPPIGHQKPPHAPRARRATIKPKAAKTPKAPKVKRERAEPTLYEVLGVDAKAEPEVIEAAWKAGMRKYHPDTNRTKSAEARSKAINAAHDILRDPEKRKAYDLRLKLELV